MKYCPLCRSELSHRTIDGRARLGCSSAECRFVHWDNPIPVVARLVRLADGYVLARNATWPAGLFSFLTGFIETGETPESAAVRETREELGVRAQNTQLIGHFPLPQLNQLELAAFDFGPLRLTSEIVSSWLQRARPGSG